MNKNEIYSKLRGFCNGRLCINCPISSINSKHKCGNGYGYFLNTNPVPLPEALKYYSIIYGKQNLRTLIEKKGEYKYERRI